MIELSRFSFEQFIDSEGRVDYHKLSRNNQFNELINQIKSKNLQSFTTKVEEFVFWLNTYNLLALKGVLNKLEENPTWNGTNSLLSRIKFFYLQKFDIGGKRISLYTIENKILRLRFKDPRLHFAINCASISCPVLPDSILQPDNLNIDLNDLTRKFINSINVIVDEKNNQLILNPIFKWYSKDFDQQGGIIEFIKKYKQDLPQYMNNPKIIFSRYDWSLNNKSN